VKEPIERTSSRFFSRKVLFLEYLWQKWLARARSIVVRFGKVASPETTRERQLDLAESLNTPRFSCFVQTKSGGGEKTADMRGGTGKTGGDPPQESGEGGPHRGEEEEREVAHRLCVW